MSYDKFRSSGYSRERTSSFSVAPEIESSAIRSYLMSLDCPRALSVYMLYQYGEHEQLAALKCDPSHYPNGDDARDAYAATKFLSKFQGLNLGYDLDKVALEKFKTFEEQCKLTNSRFRWSQNPLAKQTKRVVWLHNAVIRKISEILGEFDFSSFYEDANWGPGATTLLKARSANSANKFQREAGITRDLYSFLVPCPRTTVNRIRDNYPMWWRHLESTAIFPVFQVGNKIVTVPKDATTNRVIAIEPGWNLWFQKAIGDQIGKALRRRGIDLRDQSLNQELARKSSLSDLNATVDFSSASDSISLELVRELLPPTWFEIMDVCRSHYGSLGDVTFRHEKFSSMGNGFTFQLESLLFYATALCCAEYSQCSLSKSGEFVSVYGDDVIVPSRCLELFSELCDFYGFTINRAKTHVFSPFRESCGAHFYSGLCLKPVYHKDRLSGLSSVYRMANAIRRFAHRGMFSRGCDKRFEWCFRYLVKSVPKLNQLRIPETLGDGGFISNFDEATPVRAKHWVEGYFVLNLADVSVTYESDIEGILLASLWGPSRDMQREGEEHLRSRTREKFCQSLVNVSVAGGNSLSTRGRVRAKVRRSLVQQWYDLGPWVS